MNPWPVSEIYGSKSSGVYPRGHSCKNPENSLRMPAVEYTSASHNPERRLKLVHL